MRHMEAVKYAVYQPCIRVVFERVNLSQSYKVVKK
jgi:hypothetical protein